MKAEIILIGGENKIKTKENIKLIYKEKNHFYYSRKKTEHYIKNNMKWTTILFLENQNIIAQGKHK